MRLHPQIHLALLAGRGGMHMHLHPYPPHAVDSKVFSIGILKIYFWMAMFLLFQFSLDYI
jgi:hypothetical protein